MYNVTFNIIKLYKKCCRHLLILIVYKTVWKCVQNVKDIYYITKIQYVCRWNYGFWDNELINSCIIEYISKLTNTY